MTARDHDSFWVCTNHAPSTVSSLSRYCGSCGVPMDAPGRPLLPASFYDEISKLAVQNPSEEALLQEMAEAQIGRTHVGCEDARQEPSEEEIRQRLHDFSSDFAAGELKCLTFAEIKERIQSRKEKAQKMEEPIRDPFAETAEPVSQTAWEEIEEVTKELLHLGQLKARYERHHTGPEDCTLAVRALAERAAIDLLNARYSHSGDWLALAFRALTSMNHMVSTMATRRWSFKRAVLAPYEKEAAL